MALDYPITLPCPQTELVTPFERAQYSDPNRPREARALSLDRLAIVRATWPPLSPAQAAIFQEWWKTDIYQGGAWFNATWPLPQGSVPSVFQFIQQPRWRFVPGGHWRIEAVLEQRGRTLSVIDGPNAGVPSNPWNSNNFLGGATFADDDFTAIITGPGNVVSVEAAEGNLGAGLYYAELVPTFDFFEGGVARVEVGVSRDNPGSSANGGGYDLSGAVYGDGALDRVYDPIVSGDVIMIALDAGNGYLYLGVNGTWLGDSNPTTGDNPIGLGPSGQNYWLSFYADNVELAYACAIRTGTDRFTYGVPAGYTAWNVQGA